MLVVITGGARSGKSSVAEALAADSGLPVTVAVFGARTDAEMERRIALHRERRPGSFQTLEATGPLEWLERAGEGLLVVECLGTLVSMIMDGCFAAHTPDPGTAALAWDLERDVEERTDEVVARIIARAGDTIVVTNEVGDSVVPAYPAGRLFRDVLGRANRRLVVSADRAYLVVAGRCIDLAGLPASLTWE